MLHFNRRERSKWGLSFPQNEAHVEYCQGFDPLMPKHCVWLHVKEGNQGTFWSSLCWGSKDVLAFPGYFGKHKTKNKQANNKTLFQDLYLHFTTSVYSVLFCQHRFQGVRKSQVCFNFLCLLKINMLGSCLVVSLSSLK